MTEQATRSADRSPSQTQAERLESWKEIAAYLKRDVRTVQRWERRGGLPVHRRDENLGGVYAYRSELDVWRRNGHSLAQDQLPETTDPTRHRDDSERPRILETVARKGYRLVAKLAATTRHDISAPANKHNPFPDTGLHPPIGPLKKANLSEPSASDPKGHLEKLRAKGTRIGFLIIVLAFLCIGIWWISRTSADTNSAAIQVIPLAGVPQGYQSEASFSPDGNHVAFSQRGKQNPGIYTTLVDGEKSLRLTNNPVSVNGRTHSRSAKAGSSDMVILITQVEDVEGIECLGLINGGSEIELQRELYIALTLRLIDQSEIGAQSYVG